MSLNDADGGSARQDAVPGAPLGSLALGVEDSPGLVFALDAERRMVAVSEPLAARLHVASADLIGHHCYEHVHGTDVAPEGCPFQLLLAGAALASGEMHSEALGGDFLVTTSAARDAEGGLLGAVHTAVNITERVRLESALREKEEQVRAVLDNSPCGMHMYRLEAGDRLVFTGRNRTAETMLGLDHRPLLGLTLEEAFPGNAGTETAVAYHGVAREGTRYETSEYAYDAEGISGVFAVHAFRYGLDRVAAFFRDITE